MSTPSDAIDTGEVHLGMGVVINGKPAKASCGIGNVTTWATDIHSVDCVDCLYEVAWVILDRARKLGRE